MTTGVTLSIPGFQNITIGAEDCVSNITLYSGPLFLSGVFTFMLFGVLCQQVYMYYLAFPKDPSWLKTIVYVAFINEVILTGLAIDIGWTFFGSGFGSLKILFINNSPASIPQPVLTGVAAALFHGFYAFRIYKLTCNPIVPCIIGIMSAGQFALTIYISVTWAHESYQSVPSKFDTPFEALFAIDSFIILMMTTVLIWTFARHRKAAAFQPTVNKLGQLIIFTTETALISACITIADTVLWFASPDTFLWIMLFPCLAKMYSISLMASLNSRMKFGTEAGTVLSATSLSFQASGGSGSIQ